MTSGKTPLCLALLLATGCAPSSSAISPPPAADATTDAEVRSFGDAMPFNPLAPSDASLGSRVTVFFGTTCAGGPESFCHSSGAGELHLVLGDGGDTVLVRSSERPELYRVAPGNLDASYLFLKVSGDAGIDGEVMPPGERPDPRIPALVAAWIEAGAPSR